MDVVNRTIKLRDICRALGIQDRHARYVLERGFIPKGVSKAPGSGEHREFTPHQAFWFGMALKLKEFGLRPPLAAKIADYADGAARTVAQNLGWDHRFLPRAGRFETEYQYCVEVADATYIRMVTNACPSQEKPYEFDWHAIKKPGIPVKGVRPCVVLRLDVSLIAAQLGAAFTSVDTA